MFKEYCRTINLLFVTTELCILRSPYSCGAFDYENTTQEIIFPDRSNSNFVMEGYTLFLKVETETLRSADTP